VDFFITLYQINKSIQFSCTIGPKITFRFVYLRIEIPANLSSLRLWLGSVLAIRKQMFQFLARFAPVAILSSVVFMRFCRHTTGSRLDQKKQSAKAFAPTNARGLYALA
jgi:hypothetical protein